MRSSDMRREAQSSLPMRSNIERSQAGAGEITILIGGSPPRIRFSAEELSRRLDC
jgi:hypothetical protein